MATNTSSVKVLRAVGRAYQKKWAYLAAFLAVFFVTLATLAALDLLPEKKEEVKVAQDVKSEGTSVAALAPEMPVRVRVPGAGIDVAIKNPQSTDVAVLDAALLTGAVRYPTSARLGEEGNVVLFGHSSYLPVVNNPSFKAFNEIQNLAKGDEIIVESEGMAYVYAVSEVREADANEDAIPLTKSGYTLTLATCDSFGKKTDRFIVTAQLVETYTLGS